MFLMLPSFVLIFYGGFQENGNHLQKPEQESGGPKEKKKMLCLFLPFHFQPCINLCFYSFLRFSTPSLVFLDFCWCWSWARGRSAFSSCGAARLRRCTLVQSLVSRQNRADIEDTGNRRKECHVSFKSAPTFRDFYWRSQSTVTQSCLVAISFGGKSPWCTFFNLFFSFSLQASEVY